MKKLAWGIPHYIRLTSSSSGWMLRLHLTVHNYVVILKKRNVLRMEQMTAGKCGEVRATQ